MKKIIVKKPVRVESYILEEGDIILLEDTAKERVADDKEDLDRAKEDLEKAQDNNNDEQKIADLKAEINKLKLDLARDTVEQDEEEKKKGGTISTINTPVEKKE